MIPCVNDAKMSNHKSKLNDMKISYHKKMNILNLEEKMNKLEATKSMNAGNTELAKMYLESAFRKRNNKSRLIKLISGIDKDISNLEVKEMHQEMHNVNRVTLSALTDSDLDINSIESMGDKKLEQLDQIQEVSDCFASFTKDDENVEDYIEAELNLMIDNRLPSVHPINTKPKATPPLPSVKKTGSSVIDFVWSS